MAIYGGFKLAESIRLKNLRIDLDSLHDKMKNVPYAYVEKYQQAAASVYKKHGFNNFAKVINDYSNHKMTANQYYENITKLSKTILKRSF